MKQTNPLAITISRQFGSGGGYIGQQLARKLNIYYADREILSRAAKQLAVLEEDLESRDEKLLSFWKSFLHMNGFSPEVYIPPKMNFPLNRELFETESEIIEQIANEQSSVIIGRCGFHILREYSNRVSIFLFADSSFRIRRIQKLYNLTENAATELIKQNDKERTQYIETFTGKKWTDARHFDLSIDTSKIGVDKSVELILNYVKSISFNFEKN